MINGELLDAFAVFSQSLNFTTAAKQFGLSQPAFFERIQKLSEQLGARLYEKRGRHLVLTEIGSKVAAFAIEQHQRSSDFLKHLHGEDLVETVVLSAGEGVYLYLLGPVLRTFIRSHQLQLRLLTLGAKNTIIAVREGRAQLGIGVFDVIPDDMVALSLVQSPLCVAMANTHRCAQQSRVYLRDLANEPMIVTPEGQAHRDFVARAFASAQVKFVPTIEADGWPLMVQFVSLGLGIAIVNGTCVPPNDVVLKPLSELGTVTYQLITRRGAQLSASSNALRHAIVQHFAKG